MNRFVTKKGWALFQRGSFLPMYGRRSLTVRVNKHTEIYLHSPEDEPESHILVGIGVGEIELDIVPDGELAFRTDGDVYILEPEQHQERRQTSDTIYTSLDRPPPLSPEMAAIQRMMRQNELERERDRQMMMELQDDRRRMAARRASESAPQKGAAKDPAPVGEDADASPPNPEEPEGGNDPELSGGEPAGTVGKQKPAK